MLNKSAKLVFALEHIAHLGDLVEDNDYQSFLEGHIASLKYEFERQLRLEEDRTGVRA
tara:strand:- start:3646 stop:3819 length:174 start_codon:yes stop_codon:yes gene_type:complete